MPDSEAHHGPRPPVYRQHQLPLVAAVLAAAAVLILTVDSPFSYGLLNSWMTFAIVGLGFYLVFGVAGQFAFSQGAFFGLGAYASVWAAESTTFLVGVLAAIAITSVIALVFALVVVRSDHFYFAIATLAFGFIATVVFREFEAFTAPGGEVVGIEDPSIAGFRFDTDAEVAVLMLVALALVLLLITFVERSPLKREAIAFRENAVVAATLGLPTLRLRLVTFVLGSAIAGLAGSLYAHRTGFISTETFSVQLSIDIFLVLLLGGIGSMWGPLLGAAFVVWAPEQLRFVGEYRGLVYGVALLMVIVLFPQGLIGLAQRAWARIRGVPSGGGRAAR